MSPVATISSWVSLLSSGWPSTGPETAVGEAVARAVSSDAEGVAAAVVAGVVVAGAEGAADEFIPSRQDSVSFVAIGRKFAIVPFATDPVTHPFD